MANLAKKFSLLPTNKLLAMIKSYYIKEKSCYWSDWMEVINKLEKIFRNNPFGDWRFDIEATLTELPYIEMNVELLLTKKTFLHNYHYLHFLFAKVILKMTIDSKTNSGIIYQGHHWS